LNSGIPSLDLPVAGSAEPEFREVTLQAWPFRALAQSACLHALGVIGLTSISFTAPLEKPLPPPAGSTSTVIRIADHLYYVTQVAPPQRRVADPVEQRIKAPAPARAKEPVPVPVAEAAPAPRLFIPPQVRKKVVSDMTLLQPLLPPAAIEVVPHLPSFVIATADLRAPRILKPLIVPGRRTPPPPTPVQPVPPPPNLDLLQADPSRVNSRPALVLPPSLPSLADTAPPQAVPVPPAVPLGDPVDILSLNSRQVPLSEQLIIPPGNIGGPTGNGATQGSGGSGSNPRSPATVARVTTNPADLRGATATTAPGGSPAGDRGSPSSESSKATGVTGSRGGDVTILGGNTPSKPFDGPRLIIRPASGTFDAVVVQSNPLDQFPESKGLLTGRPIYTVYISVGTAKDWALYFCMPGDAQPGAAGGRAVNLGSLAPVQPPYPTRMLRPEIETPPPYYKYILVHGFVTAAGRMENLSVVRPIKPETDQAVVASLATWEFRAATRDGVKTPVEFLLSIPISGL
jgi:hypothetical protein